MADALGDRRLMTLDELRQTAAILDRDDPLAQYRDHFHIPRRRDGRAVTYLCGHSLGLPPRAAAASVHRELQAWAELGVEGHFQSARPWVSFHELFTPHLAQLVGAEAHEVVAMNTLTVNLHLMLTSFYRPTSVRRKILVGHAAFPSDRYAIAAQIALRGWQPEDTLLVAQPRPGEATLRTEDVVDLIDRHAHELHLVLMDGVNYYTGEFLDIATITAAAHRHGILAGFDLAHAAGNVPLALHAWGVDFAVWCHYKYLNGGPGCVAGCFVHERHGLARDPLPRLAGWWGHEKSSRFAMGPDFVPIPGAEGWQLSNPPLFSLAALLPSLELFSEIGMVKLRAKSEQLTGLLDRAFRALLPEAVNILTPPEPARRGCQLSVRLTHNAKSIFHALLAAGVICDWREPDVIRLAPVPLYNRFADVVRCVEVLTCAQ
ncbi:MAG: kynureninase [Gemmataceae bacterium]|nr:kynureninase [Gemmata sp.]MDW8197923.1 kynureninase [Gemmataceae bacterium]